MIVRMGEWVPVVFDVLCLPEIWLAATKCCSWLRDTFKVAALSPAWAESYVQEDAWSCGHRILTSWSYLLCTRPGC